MEVADAPSQISFTPDLQDVQKYLEWTSQTGKASHVAAKQNQFTLSSTAQVKEFKAATICLAWRYSCSTAFSHLSAVSELGAYSAKVPFYKGKLLQKAIQTLKYFSILNFPSRNLSHFTDRTGALVDYTANFSKLGSKTTSFSFITPKKLGEERKKKEKKKGIQEGKTT